MDSTLPPTRLPAYRRIADSLRKEIMSGQREAGAQLPSTNDLAAQLNISPYTVHTALTRLVKEGWLERLNGTGTYVTDPGRRFIRAGIYHAGDICSNERPPFIRNVHTALLEKFKQRGKETHVFMDTRPLEQQTDIMPALQKALEERSIQCLVVPTMSPAAAPELEKLRLPTAFLSSRRSPHQITISTIDFMTKSVTRLVEQGCRSIGLLSNLDLASDQVYTYREKFVEAVQKAGVRTRPEWMLNADHFLVPSEYDAYAYQQFHRLWRLDERPDGLVVYPDVLVHGLLTAALEIGIDVVPPRMKFIFHRNLHLNQICPFPVTWAVSDEDAWAEALIHTIERQFDGEVIEPTLIPFTLQENVPPPR